MGEYDKKIHYCVVYTDSKKQWSTTEFIKKSLPEGQGEVFYPCVELWWHGKGEKTKYRPLFPGYIFIRSELSPVELHGVIRKSRKDILSFIKELHVSETRAAGESVFDSEEYEDTLIMDLTDEEAAFFESILGFEYDGEYDYRRQIARDQGLYMPVYRTDEYTQTDKLAIEAFAEMNRRRNSIPQKGVVQISYGYREKDGRYVVMDGPLRGFEDHITGYKGNDKKAYIDISLGGMDMKAGLVILGKKAWYPDDYEAGELLSDGSEFRSDELSKKMFSNYFDKREKHKKER